MLKSAVDKYKAWKGWQEAWVETYKFRREGREEASLTKRVTGRSAVDHFIRKRQAHLEVVSLAQFWFYIFSYSC